jgi:hypothetical protein
MTALVARCEVGGGARQQSRFNNCGEGASAARSLSDISGWRDGVLYPLARGCRIRAVGLGPDFSDGFYSGK